MSTMSALFVNLLGRLDSSRVKAKPHQWMALDLVYIQSQTDQPKLIVVVRMANRAPVFPEVQSEVNKQSGRAAGETSWFPAN